MTVPYEDLDAGIWDVVHWLNEHGFTTIDSGDGKEKFQEDGTPLPEWKTDDSQDFECVIPHPHVVMAVPVEKLGPECDRLRDLLLARGVELGAVGPDGDDIAIQGSYDPMLTEHPAYIMLMGLDDTRWAVSSPA